MEDLLLYFAIIAISGVIFLPLHIFAIRAMRGRKLITTINAAILGSMILGVAIGWVWLGGLFSSGDARLVSCVAAALTFAAYAGLYGLLGPSSVDRSVSVHIVKLLWLAPGRHMTEAELLGVYTHADMLAKRFRDCLDTGIIERRGDELVLTPHGSRIAAVYMAIATWLGMRTWYLDRFYAMRATRN